MKNKKKASHWSKHFRFYDLFQMNFSNYLTMMGFHRKNVIGLKNILDSGAGSGNLTLMLLKDKHKVVAVDNNDAALNILRNKCKKYRANLTIKKQDLNKPLKLKSQSFDGVVSSIVIPFLNNNLEYFQEINRVLKSNGVLSLSAWLPKRGLMDSKYMMPKLERELKAKKLLPKFDKEWEEIWITSRKNEDIIVKNGREKKDIISFLKKVGFNEIREWGKKPYGDYAFFATAQKT